MITVDTIERDGYIGRLVVDDDPMNPRKVFDNLTTMVCGHRDYILGDTTLRELTGYDVSEFLSMAHIERYVRMRFKAQAFTWLGLYDHSGISIYAGGGPHWQDSAGWDSGTVGFAFVGEEEVRKTGAPLDSLERQMLAEIKEYDQYLTGNVYGYVIEDPDGEHVDSCCGFYGYQCAREEMEREFHGYLNSIPGQLGLQDA